MSSKDSKCSRTFVFIYQDLEFFSLSKASCVPPTNTHSRGLVNVVKS